MPLGPMGARGARPTLTDRFDQIQLRPPDPPPFALDLGAAWLQHRRPHRFGEV